MKTKKQRQDWWESLSPEKKDKFISKKARDRFIRNNKRDLKLMKRLKLSFDCKLCIHGLTESCIDKPKNGCLYFADETNKVFGPKAS